MSIASGWKRDLSILIGWERDLSIVIGRKNPSILIGLESNLSNVIGWIVLALVALQTNCRLYVSRMLETRQRKSKVSQLFTRSLKRYLKIFFT